MLPTYEQIKPYIEKGLISEQIHPEDANIAIFNYTQECQFSQAWDDVTRQCRGLILNVATGECLARPFPKFFNYGEHVTKGWAIPTSHPKVYEKLDGSLGILYNLNGEEWIATRGSFTSEQALWATKWWRENIPSDPTPSNEKTHLFEIIYPQNRIVVNYDFSGLVYLATLDTKSGRSLPDEWPAPIRIAKEIPYTDMETLEKLDEPNSEGFVLLYPEENMRMKIKFPEYVRLHKLVTGLSEIAIWEHLRDGKDLSELVSKVPDEFFRWVTEVSDKLTSQFAQIELEAKISLGNVHPEMSRKEAAEVININPHQGVVFAMLDGKPYAPMIWKMLRPHGRSQFKIDIDS